MTSTTAPPETGAPHPDRATLRGSLLRSEIHRFSARRFIRILLVLAIIGYLGIVALMSFQVFGNPSAADLREAELRRDQAVMTESQNREQCLQADTAQLPEGMSVEEACGREITAEDFPIENFLDRQPFELAGELQSGAVGVGVVSSMLAFLIGATYVGAEWSTRSMVALLFWEPRRLRVVAVKLLVTAGMSALLGVLAQALWVGTSLFLATTRGTTKGLPEGFWADVLAQQGRCVALVALMGLLGFSLANLIRNTGACLGVAFVYSAIVETAVRIFRPSWQEWLLTENIAALLTEGGHRVFLGQGGEEPREVLLSNLHGALVIGGVTALFVAIGVTLFKRRDLH